MSARKPSADRAELELARRAYREISLYSVDRSPCAVDLSDNTNLFGIPPAAERAYREAAVSSLTRYPPLYAAQLKAALASYAGVSAAEVVTGCGSDDVLDSAMRAFAEPGETLATSDPSFAMVPIFGQMNGLRVNKIRLTASLDIDAEGLAATGAKVFYVCSPNNPTGMLASRAAVEKLLELSRGVILLDEAYAEFSQQEGFLRLAPSLERLLVVRTLSKAFGLAGLRIGYAVGPAALIAEVEKSRGPYKVSGSAERAALAALTEDRPWVEEHIAEVIQNRGRLADSLRQIGLSPLLPSSSNFLLVPVKDAASLAKRMREEGVAVRPFPQLTALGDAIRISIGPWPMMEAALAALRRALG